MLFLSDYFFQVNFSDKETHFKEITRHLLLYQSWIH